MKNPVFTLITIALTIATPRVHAGTHTWRGNASALWSNPANWDEGIAPQAGETPLGIVIPTSPTRPVSTNNVTGLLVDSITFQGGSAAIHGNAVITLRSPVLISILCAGNSNVISAPLALTARHVFSIGASGSLILAGPVSGNGGITKMARGSLTLSGAEPNTYTGRTEFRGDGGTLHLDKGDLFDAIAIPGDLIVGDADQNNFPVSVIYHRANQVADTAKVFVGPNCTYALDGQADAIGSLALVSGTINTAHLGGPGPVGSLTLFGNVTVSNSPANFPAGISGALSLGGAVRTIDVEDFSVLHLNAAVSDGVGTGGMTKTGAGTLQLAGASTFNGDVTVSQGTLEVLHNAALGSLGGGTIVQSGTTLRLGNVNVSGEHLYLNGAGFTPLFSSGAGALELKSANASWAGVVTLQSDSTIDVAENLTLTLGGLINGPGSLILHGLGTVQFAGSTANTYGGATFAHGALLLLAKASLATAVPGPLFVAQPNPAANNAYVPPTNVVRLLAPQQLNPAAPLTLESPGMLDLNGYSQSVGPIAMTGGVITNTSGTLILNDDVVGTTLWNNSPSIYGKVSLGGSTRTFTSLTPGAIFVYGPISDGLRPAGIIKKGPYGLALEHTNSTYTGVTLIEEGWLSAVQPGSLGSIVEGTVVASGAELAIGLNFHGPAELLTLNDGSRLYSVGYNSWDGNIAVSGNPSIIVDTAANNETLDLNGAIYGLGGLTFALGGTLRFGGTSANSYSGTTTVLGDTTWNTLSTLELRKPNGVIAIPGPLIIGSATNPPAHEVVRLFSHGQIADGAPVTVNASGLLDLNNRSDVVGSLAGAGLVDLQLGDLTCGGNNADTTFSGTIAGTSFAAQFIKEGTGALTLTGTNTLSGSMMVNNGRLYANAQQTSSIFISPNGQLHGQGKVGHITGLGGWSVPGDMTTAPTHGALKSWSLTLDAASSFNIDLGGPVEGADYNQLVVTGTVNLGGAQLRLTESFAGAVSNQFVIIRNDAADAVVGTFKDLPEGTAFDLGPGRKFRINYAGGDGNDVVLTQLAVPQPANIGKIVRHADGQIEFTATGSPNSSYDIEANSDLNTTNWIKIGSVLSDALGNMVAADQSATNFPIRFYRFVLP